MIRDYVNSSMIMSVGYDYDTAILEVEFKKNHQIWDYYDVPLYIFEQLRTSESCGKFFLSSIRGQYREGRVA
jgi:hypothetical protein